MGPPRPACLHGPCSADRIIGGTEVEPYSISYQASLRFFGQHFCGGTLIHEQWVISAAHCWRPSYPSCRPRWVWPPFRRWGSPLSRGTPSAQCPGGA
uniref:Peptidase S1 domain-containing protein n=1 Tax=Periophthalmus magnuspinnatus TaxID=409849 RepID=A0A3B4A6E6_9GOBI